MSRKVKICTARVCEDCGSKDLMRDALRHAESRPQIIIEKRHCLGNCEEAPNIQIVDGEDNEMARHSKVTPQEMQRIIESL